MAAAVPSSTLAQLRALHRASEPDVLKPLLERASVKPKVVETKPKRPTRPRKIAVSEDEPDLIAAK